MVQRFVYPHSALSAGTLLRNLRHVHDDARQGVPELLLLGRHIHQSGISPQDISDL